MEKRGQEAEQNSKTSGKTSRRGLLRAGRNATGVFVVIALISILVNIVLYARLQRQAEETETPAAQLPVEGDGADDGAVEVLSDEVVYTQEQVDDMLAAAVSSAIDSADSEILKTLRGRLENGEGTMAILRDLYPGHVVMQDSGQFFFLPLQEDLAFNAYEDEKFIEAENGIVTYEEAGETVTKKGIDVSKYQGKIDWAAVKDDGVDYAIIRLGVRGYSEGKLKEDEFFRQNMEGAAANGIPVGVYFFTQAINAEEALEEANYVIELLKGYTLTYPVYLDVEDVKKENCRTNALTAAERTEIAKVFLEAVRAAGYEPGIYGNMKTFLLMLDLASLEQYDKWFAGYTLPIYYPYEYKMLQYSDKAKVAGVPGNVDVNICFKDYERE